MSLPPFSALLVVDAEEFSRNRDVDQPRLHTEIGDVVARACERSGLGDVWQAAGFRQSTGDGVLAVFPLEAGPALIHPFVDRLQDALCESASRLRTHGLRLRLRVALHVGLVDDEHPVTAGISTATTEVCRLLNCDPLRAALRDSDPDVTFAAAVISAEAFETFVRGGYTGLHPSQFTQVRAEVKQFDRPAFRYVPTPSTRERPRGDPAPDADAPLGSEAPNPSQQAGVSFGNVTVSGNAGQNVIGSTITGQNVVGSAVTGDLRQERP